MGINGKYNMCKMLQKMLGYFLLSQLGLIVQDMRDAELPLYQIAFFGMIIGVPAIYMIEDAIIAQYGLFNDPVLRQLRADPNDDNVIILDNPAL